jgi:hypothetical protein
MLYQVPARAVVRQNRPMDLLGLHSLDHFSLALPDLLYLWGPPPPNFVIDHEAP